MHNPSNQAPPSEPRITRSSNGQLAIPVATHHPGPPSPFPINRKIADIDPSRIMDIIDELPAATQLADTFNVLRENSHARDGWETRVRQWRKYRPVTIEFVFDIIDLSYGERRCFKSSNPTNALRAAVTYNKLRLDALLAGELELGVQAAKKTLDYLLLCSFQGKLSAHGLSANIPEHEKWFSEAIEQINPSIKSPLNPSKGSPDRLLDNPKIET